jgi:Carboxylesterase family
VISVLEVIESVLRLAMRYTLLAALFSAVSVNGQSVWSIGQAVKTTSGSIVGQASSWKKEVSEYLGVPFAAPPVGPLRWAAPQPFKGDGKTIQATKYVSFENIPSRIRRSNLNLGAVSIFAIFQQLSHSNESQGMC